MRAARRASSAASTDAKRPTHSPMMSRRAGQLRRRWSGVAKRGSVASSGRPSSSRRRGHRAAAPPVWSARCRPPTAYTPMAGRGEPCVSDRKSTRLNSSHDQISYAVFSLKKKKKKGQQEIETKKKKRRSAKNRKKKQT